jgi:hypothetical protein
VLTPPRYTTGFRLNLTGRGCGQVASSSESEMNLKASWKKGNLLTSLGDDHLWRGAGGGGRSPPSLNYLSDVEASSNCLFVEPKEDRQSGGER